MKHHKTDRRKQSATLRVLSLLLALAIPLTGVAASEGPPSETHDGLQLVPDRTVWAAYVDPQADFSGYDRIMILDCDVAFVKDWEKKKKTGSHSSVSSGDMERIKAEIAGLFRTTFTEKLKRDGGYEIVHAPDDGVLLVRAAIIDLDITAPDRPTAGRSRTYTTSSGAATLYIELFDSVTGAPLARAIDRKAARAAGSFLTYTNSVTNRADARRALGSWADMLRARLDEFRGK